MDRAAKVVIIGAGVVGCSVAYHLTKKGWTDVVVLDQGPLFQTGGSTSHAPGLVFQTNASKTMTKFAQYTVELFSKLKLNGEPCFYPVGGMEVAYTEERMQELKRKLGHAMSWGLASELLSPSEAKSKIPLLDSSRIYGAYYVPSDGIAKTLRACESLAKEAEARGARFHGNTEVMGLEVEQNRVRSVLTDAGRISVENVLICAGIWGPKVGRMAGIRIPLVPVEHQYARTSAVPELEGETREVTHPILRHQDRSMYFRQHGDSYGIGSYLHEPRLVSPDSLLKPGRAPVMPSVVDFTPHDFQRALAAAHELLPPLKNTDLVYKINGIFSFTPDGMPVLGESLDVRGLWVAEAVWITHGGGVGKVIAEWIADGVPSLDLRECDLNRFHEHALTPEYIGIRGAQQYREVYDIIHPLQQIKYPRNLRVSPFHQRMQDLGGVFFENVGWERPQWFERNQRLLDGGDWPVRSGWEARYWSPIQGAEHKATRERVAMYDLSPFVKIEVQGPKAFDFMQSLCANQIDQPTGKVVYTSMLNKNGGIVCDLTATRLGDDRFLVLTGATSGMHDLAWMRSNMPSDGSVQLTDVTSNYSCIGLWGPRALEVAESVSDDDLSPEEFKSFTARRITIGNVPVLALRVSYVGEMGWEIYTQSCYGLALWDTLWSAGQPLGLVAAGGGAFDSLRLEKGYRLWGVDVYSEHNSYEAGLGFTVKMEKGDFVGRNALLRIKDLGITRKLSRLYFDEPNRVVMGKEPILYDGRVLGYVTSSNYGYTIGKGIAYGYLPIDYAKEGTNVEVYYFGRPYPATVVSERR